MRRLFVALLLTIATVFFVAPGRDGKTAAAQETPCLAPALDLSKAINIFTPAQEMDLSDAMAERFEPWLRIIDDPVLTERLQKIGSRLVSHLPPTGLNFRFNLIDIPDANAFAMAGGRLYVSRKMVAFTQSEDELAGVLGHELGHVVARQQTIEITKQLRDVINVTAVGDRNDVFAKYNQLMDNAGRKPGAFTRADREGRDQIEADRIGIFIVAAAGYDPKAQVTMFDRYAETGGKSGSLLSKMFGTTSGEAKRLGEMMKAAGTVTPGCAERPDPARAEAYRSWQIEVGSYSALDRKADLPGLVSEKALAPIRAEITHLKFSADGKYLLAQDDAGISVLSREPLAVLFRISESDVEPAQFSADSTEVIVHTGDLRIERWTVASKKITTVRDLFRPAGCRFTSVSPDGKVAACLASNEELSLIDVTTGQPFFVKKGFQIYSAMNALYTAMSGLGTARTSGSVTLAFSPDGRFFAGTSVGYSVTNTVVFDLSTRTPVALKGAAKSMLSSTFTFVGANRIVGFNTLEPAKSGILQLPAGDVVEQFALPNAELAGPAKGNVVFLRPFQRYAVAVFDLAKKTVVKGTPTEAMDVFDDVYVAERGTGDIGVYAMEGNALRGSVTVPSTELARLRSATVSDDFGWVAVSARTRGVLWNATTGDRVAMVRDFDGAYIDETGSLFADLPRSGQDRRSIMKLDPQTRVLGKVNEVLDRYAYQYGQQFLILHMLPLDTTAPTGVEFEMRDVRNNHAVWRKTYPKNPPDDYWPNPRSDAFVLLWEADGPAGREMIRLNPDLRNRAKLGDIQGDFILQVIDGSTGAIRGNLLVETGKGSFHIDGVLTAGDTILITDSLDRVLVYSLSANELKGYAIGTRPVVNTKSNVLVVGVGPDRLVSYDLQTLKRQKEFRFAADVVVKAIGADGKQLFALTSDQKAYVLNLK